MPGGRGILVVKFVGLVLEAGGGLVAAEGDPILPGGGEIVLVEKSLDGGHITRGGRAVDGRSRSDGGREDGCGSGGSEHYSFQ